MTSILPQVEELMLSLKQLMPSIYQEETLESILGLILSGRGNAIPHHCQTKSESAISRFLNYYNWSTRSVIRTIRSYILNLIQNQRIKGRKPVLQVILDLTTLEKVGDFPHLNNLVRVYNHKKGLHIVVMYLVIGNWRFPWSCHRKTRSNVGRIPVLVRVEAGIEFRLSSDPKLRRRQDSSLDRIR
jgi:hypothetical protein